MYFLEDGGQVCEALAQVAEVAGAHAQRELRERRLRWGRRFARSVGSWETVTAAGIVRVLGLVPWEVRVVSAGGAVVPVVPVVLRVRVPVEVLPWWVREAIECSHRGFGLGSFVAAREGERAPSLVFDVWCRIVDPPSVAVKYRSVGATVRESVVAVPHGFGLEMGAVAEYAAWRRWRCASEGLRSLLGLEAQSRSPMLGGVLRTMCGAARESLAGRVYGAAWQEGCGRVVCHRGNLSIGGSPKLGWLAVAAMARWAGAGAGSGGAVVWDRATELPIMRAGVFPGVAMAGVYSPWFDDQRALRAAKRRWERLRVQRLGTRAGAGGTQSV